MSQETIRLQYIFTATQLCTRRLLLGAKSEWKDVSQKAWRKAEGIVAASHLMSNSDSNQVSKSKDELGGFRASASELVLATLCP